MTENRNRPAANEAAPNNNHPQDTGSTRHAPRELSAWLRSRVQQATDMWESIGSPEGAAATLSALPHVCSRCGGHASHRMNITALTTTGALLILAALCDTCHELEAVAA